MSRSRRRRRTGPRFDPRDSMYDSAIVEELDLHGYTAQEANRGVRAFLESWSRRAPGSVVRIITGRGKSSARGPILKPLVASLLKGELKHLVVDWCPDLHEAGYLVRLR